MKYTSKAWNLGEKDLNEAMRHFEQVNDVLGVNKDQMMKIQDK